MNPPAPRPGLSRKRIRSLAVLLLALATGSYLLVRVTNSDASARTSVWPRGGPPTFLPPRGWRVYHLDSGGSTVVDPAAFLSNRPVALGWPPGCMRDEPVDRCAPGVPSNLVNQDTGLADCTPHNTVTVCAPANTPLASDQALVQWSEADLPGAPANSSPPGARITVDGHEARLIIGKGTLLACPRGTSESISARVFIQPPVRDSRPPYSSWYGMDACLRGPGLARLQAQVLSIFRSVRDLP